MGIAYNTSIVRDGLVLHLDAANKKSYPGSGTNVNNLTKEIGGSLILSGQGFVYISENTASQKGYGFGPVDVKGESDIEGSCSGLMTFQQAVEYVHSFGARLPTLDEVRRDAAVGSGCGYDNEYIWTADGVTQSGEEHYVIYGRTDTNGTTAVPRDINSTAFVRYVSDVDINRPDPSVVISDNLKSILESVYSATFNTFSTTTTIEEYESPSVITLNNGMSVTNNHFDFDGTDDYISTNKGFLKNPNELNIGNSSYTIEAWVYPEEIPSGTGTSGSSVLGHASSRGIGLNLFNDGGFRVNFGYRSNDNFNSNALLNTNNWYHIVATREVGVNNRIYINGVLDSTANSNILNVYDTAAEIQIGYAESRIGYFTGKIGIVNAYNISFNDEQVKQNFEAMRGRYGI